MPKLTLNKLRITCFKGIDYFELDLDGGNAVITAENGIGKTTIYDAFLWLLFGKDSTGRKDFEVRPLDRHNRPIKGVVLAVGAEIDIDGVKQVFRKEHHEKVVKGQLRGYETLCWINEVPRKVGEYAEIIAKIISEETFKLLTDLHFFNSKLHWTDRRQVLLAVAGEIGTPEGFEELLDALNGRTIDEYKKVLSEQKKRHTKERDEINPRIDEILKGLVHPTNDVQDLDNGRMICNINIKELDRMRQELLGKETERIHKIDKKNELILAQGRRESELASDTSGVDALLEEKGKIATKVAEAEQLVSTAEKELNIATGEKMVVETTQQSLMLSRDIVYDDFKEADKKPKVLVCYACGKKLSKDDLALNEEKRQARLNEIKARGDELKRKIGENTKKIVALEENIKLLTEAIETSKKDWKATQAVASKRLKEIDKAIKSCPTPKPEDDEAWRLLVASIAKNEAEIGPPVAEQLEAIEAERTKNDTELQKLNEELAQADRIEKDRTRIKELEAKEKELAQTIADIEKQLADIQQYKAKQSTMITTAVNCKFKAVEFKMFKELLNGGLEECCEAILKGIPYPDMSTGEDIYVGIDITNVLSEHYDIFVPVFIDNAESYGMSLESNSQTIRLKFEKGVKQLQVTKTSAKERAVA